MQAGLAKRAGFIEQTPPVPGKPRGKRPGGHNRAVTDICGVFSYVSCERIIASPDFQAAKGVILRVCGFHAQPLTDKPETHCLFFHALKTSSRTGSSPSSNYSFLTA